MDHTHDKANSMLDTIANLLTPSKGKQNNHESSGSDSDIQDGQFHRMVLKKKKICQPKLFRGRRLKIKGPVKANCHRMNLAFVFQTVHEMVFMTHKW